MNPLRLFRAARICRYRMMSSSSRSPGASPFTRAVVAAMRKLYPESLADKSFDNTGLLLEAPFHPPRRQMNSVLLTVDLTREVATEAIENRHGCVVAYHPIIFRGLKSLTLADAQQSSLLRLAVEGISVYCPHTAVDAVPGGMADWLCDILAGAESRAHPEQRTDVSDAEPITKQPSDPPEGDEAHSSNVEMTSTTDVMPEEDVFTTDRHAAPLKSNPTKSRPDLKRAYSRPTYPQVQPASPTTSSSSSPPSAFSADDLAHTRAVISPCSSSAIGATHDPSQFPPSRTGSGRLLTFQDPQPLTHLIERIALGVGNPKGFPVAIPQAQQVEDITIRTVGICPGSGSSILRDCGADLIFTGELSHHDALAVTERGGAVVTLFHSNSERGYLHSVMRHKLQAELEAQWESLRKAYHRSGGSNMGSSAVNAADEGPASTHDDEDVERESGSLGGGDVELPEGISDPLADPGVTVDISTVDRDPFGIVVLQGSEADSKEL